MFQIVPAPRVRQQNSLSSCPPACFWEEHFDHSFYEYGALLGGASREPFWEEPQACMTLDLRFIQRIRPSCLSTLVRYHVSVLDALPFVVPFANVEESE